MEIGWAIKFGKPIVILVMQDAGFFPFDLARWQRDRCAEKPGSWPVEWIVDPWLQTKYADCPRPVRDMIEHYHATNQMIPFRRRDFEATAMLREALSRAGAAGCIWGQSLLPSTSLRDAQVEAYRNVFVICEDRTGGAVSAELQTSLRRMSPILSVRHSLSSAGAPLSSVGLQQELEESTHVVIVLTQGAGSPGSASLRQLQDTVRWRRPLLFVYQEQTDDVPNGWSFERNDAHTDLRALLNNNEAVKYRARGDRAYEHDAMVLELLKRMHPSGRRRWDSAIRASQSGRHLAETVGDVQEVQPMRTMWGGVAAPKPRQPPPACGHSIGSVKRNQVVPVSAVLEVEEKGDEFGPVKMDKLI